MLVLPLACALGAAAGWLAGGRVRHLAALRLRAVTVVALALALQLALPAVPARWRFSVVVLSYVAVGAWLVANTVRRATYLRLALALVAAGWLLNLMAVAPNGGMPVSLDAARDVGARPGFDVTRGNLSKHVPLGPETALSPLGDVIPVRPLGTVVSAGDVAMFAGIVLLIAHGMLPPRRRTHREGTVPSVGGGTERSSLAHAV